MHSRTQGTPNTFEGNYERTPPIRLCVATEDLWSTVITWLGRDIDTRREKIAYTEDCSYTATHVRIG